jgi:hypothetical protein
VSGPPQVLAKPSQRDFRANIRQKPVTYDVLESLITGNSAARVVIKQNSRLRIVNNARMSEPNIASNFDRLAVSKNICSGCHNN